MRPWETLPPGAEPARAAIASAIPRIVTERLVLDAPRLEDFDLYAQLSASEEGAWWGGPMEREAAWLDWCQMVAGWTTRGIGPWSVRTRSGALAGLVVVDHEFGDPEPEIGWFVAPAHRGEGYAEEAARAALAHADALHGAGGTVAYIDAGNPASRSVARRLGLARDEGAEAGLDDGTQVWRAPRGPAPAQARHRGTAAPTIRTARLTLRPIRMSDFEDWAAFLTSGRARYMEEGIDRDTAWAWFTHDVASWSLMGHGGLMIDVGGETVGEVAVLHPPHFPERELGWLLYEGHEGHGYATEAAAALRDHLTREGVIDTPLVSYVHPENAASAAVARRLGAEVDPDAEAPGHALVFRHPFRGAS